ncbi:MULTISPECIES: CsbD family protein [unclassified Nonomuraea]|uniref:CsbD family protein n=1 Tax=unclassified Nonomuraea TaxID=2593643 RepID=UPI0034037C34
MSMRWEIGNKLQALKGWARQRLGRTTGDRSRQSAGRADRVAGNLKQAGGKIKDAFRR